VLAGLLQSLCGIAAYLLLRLATWRAILGSTIFIPFGAGRVRLHGDLEVLRSRPLPELSRPAAPDIT